MKLYGNLMNRMAEGKNNLEPKYVGEDITMYYYSDRTCYYITRVKNDKDIFVKPYYVCADHSKESMSNEWMYFKSKQEMNRYLNSCHLKDLDGNEYAYDEKVEERNDEQEWVFRYNNWYVKYLDNSGKPQYRRLEKISFGIRNYYYDYEF